MSGARAVTEGAPQPSLSGSAGVPAQSQRWYNYPAPGRPLRVATTVLERNQDNAPALLITHWVCELTNPQRPGAHKSFVGQLSNRLLIVRFALNPLPLRGRAGLPVDRPSPRAYPSSRLRAISASFSRAWPIVSR